MVRRNQPPDRLSPQIRDHSEVVRACREWNIGRLFRVVNNLSEEPNKFTVTHIGRLCGLSVSRVGEYMNDAHQVTSVAIIERITDGLQIPGERFGLAPRPWENHPLLSTLVEMDEGQGDEMKRRALLATVTAAVGVSGGSASVLANIVRHGLLDSADAVEDWDAVVEDFSRQLVTDPSADYGEALLAQLMVAREQNIDLGATSDRLRAMAHLGQLYGLWLGNRGDVVSARGWYRSASMVADRSGDSVTRIFVKGRALSRGIYEGYTVRETIEGVEATLDISREPCLGALEAWSALVHVHGLTEDLRSGRVAVDNMQRVTDRLPDSETRKVAGPVERTASFRNYLECRVGSRRDADRTFAEVDPVLRPVPVWHAEAKIYYGCALTKDGDIANGVSLALDAAKRFGQDVRVVGVGVRDLLSVVPKGYRSDQLDELKVYAAVGPMPWETIS